MQPDTRVQWHMGIFQLVLCLLTFTTHPISAFAQNTPLTTAITDVTVFTQRAMVTRQGSVRLKQGEHQLIIAGLPTNILDDSITVNSTGSAKIVLYGANIQLSQLANNRSEQIHAIEKRILELEDKHRLETHRLTLAKEQLNFLGSIRAASLEKVGQNLVTNAPSEKIISDTLSLMKTEYASIYDEQARIETAQRQLARDIDKYRRELAQLKQPNRQKAEKSIVIETQALADGEFQLSVSYQITGASWRPIYELRSENDTGTVRLNLYGMVSQRTGEDWNNTPLTLSTAEPTRHIDLPELQPQFLQRVQPQPLLRKQSAHQSLEMDSMMYEAESAAPMMAKSPPQRADYAKADVSEQGTATTYQLAKPESIPSGTAAKKAIIGSYALPAVLSYEATPILSDKAYLSATITNNTGHILLPGQLQLFSDGAFMGKTSLPLLGIEQSLPISLGIDDTIKITYQQLSAKTDMGLLGRSKTIHYDYVTTIENHKKRPINIKIHDRIPVSQHDDITVEDIKFSPKPAATEENQPGIHRWELSIGPGRSETISKRYTVEHPADFIVQGL